MLRQALGGGSVGARWALAAGSRDAWCPQHAGQAASLASLHAASHAAAGPPQAAPAAPAASLADLQREMDAALREGRPRAALRAFLSPAAALAATAGDALAAASLFDRALRACAASADASYALALVAAMWRAGVPVGRVAHDALLRALCAAGRRGDAGRYLARLPSRALTPVMFTSVLAAFNAAGDAAGAARCAELMAKRGVTPDALASRQLLRLAGLKGDAGEVEARWREALAAPGLAPAEAPLLHAARISALAA